MNNIILKSGKIVTHQPMPASSRSAFQFVPATEAILADGKPMSNDEWEEYCAIVVKRNAAKIRKQAREAALRSCGLVKVKGALGGTYWE